jgi:glycosyltransferase involved in cell wall biosynthesis
VTNRLSIIIISLNGVALLEKCLQALLSQPSPGPIECLVVIRRLPEEVASLQALWPQVRWLHAPVGETIPRMRSLGIQASQGERIVLLEDDCVVNGSWLQAVLDDRLDAYSAVGGPIDPRRYQTRLDWCIYFCEYARFMSPFDGEVRYLPGNNVAYNKLALGKLDSQDGFYEVFLHEQWLKDGKKIYAHPGMLVQNENHWSARFAMRVPFQYGRAFAGLRFQSKSVRMRLVYALLSFLMPVVRSGRTVQIVLQRRRFVSEMVGALPWILVFNSYWSAGELMGYLFGPGASAWR